jgi:hypothetical protein
VSKGMSKGEELTGDGLVWNGPRGDDWAGEGFRPVPMGIEIQQEAAAVFLASAGLKPNQDAIDQMIEAFLPALSVMCSRDHSPDGDTWRRAGWKAQLYEIMKKTARLRYRSWVNNRFDDDSPIDLINYSGFYYRMQCKGEPWGESGDPS